MYEKLVKLRESDHRYFDDGGLEYMGFSKLMESLSPPFNENVSLFVAKAKGVSQDSVLDKWKQQRDEGTRIDEALTMYAKDGILKTENADLEDLCISVLKEYEAYPKTFEQLVVYSKEYRTAGSLDKLGLVTNRKDSTFDIIDWKCYEKGIDFHPKGQKHLNAPLDHLSNSKYNKIALQVSFYAWHVENLTGKKVRHLYIHHINPTSKEHIKIPVNYMKFEIEVFLEHSRDKIIKELNDKTEFFV